MEEELSYRMESVPEDLMSTLYPFQVWAQSEGASWVTRARGGGGGGVMPAGAAAYPGKEGGLYVDETNE